MSEQDEELTRLAEAILEGESIDWDAEFSRRPDLRPGLERLRRIERVVQVQAGDGDPDTSFGIPVLTIPPDPPDPPGSAGPLGTSVSAGASSAAGPPRVADEKGLPFRQWGDLELLELIGVGGYSEVYRAWDPGLTREVALKLIRSDRPIGAVDQQRYLAEARRLARVRHPNVLVVYGADEHQGRLGLWTELIEGQTHEEILRQEGPRGPSEAGLVAVRVCRALAAVHAAGIVHRDIKAANVMRAVGGRIVLLDFGAGAEVALDPRRGGPIPEGGTPLSMAPEQLNGLSATPASDLYAVGALLYRLLTGRHPIEAKTIEELRERATRGDWIPLRDLRPDASGACVRAVERALSPDPAMRYASAGAMEAALQATLSEINIPIPVEDEQEPPHPPGGMRWPATPWRSLAIGAAILAGLALVGELLSRREVPHPSFPAGAATTVARPLDVRAIFVRERDGQGIFTIDGDAIAPEDGLTLEIEGSDSMHAYVVQRNTAGLAYLLFPAPDLDRGNPLPPGEVHRLPGTRRGRAHHWVVSGRPGFATLITYASREPIAAFEAERVRSGAGEAADPGSDQPIPLQALERVDADVRMGPGAATAGAGEGTGDGRESIWSERVRLRVGASDR